MHILSEFTCIFNLIVYIPLLQPCSQLNALVMNITDDQPVAPVFVYQHVALFIQQNTSDSLLRLDFSDVTL